MPSQTAIDFERIWRCAIAEMHLSHYSVHGPDHWERVERNGLLLATRTGANVAVVRLFAVFHDCRREHDGSDEGHGARGAAFASRLRGILFDLPDADFELLHYACSWHTGGQVHTDPTIGTCWDADRLDLGRVGVKPKAQYMSTEFGRKIALRGTIEPFLKVEESISEGRRINRSAQLTQDMGVSQTQRTRQTNGNPSEMNLLKLDQALSNAFKSKRQITILTGAGISAESGIPTYRGSAGYWTVGSVNYQPQEIATRKMFLKLPRDVWRWTLYSRDVCLAAAPNPGHLALVEMEEMLGVGAASPAENRFALITQNIDGLHLTAGNSPERTYQVHGNIHQMRCTRGCSFSVYPLSDDLSLSSRTEELTESQWQRLVCPKCGAKARPHTLFWDEYYNEEFYRSETALKLCQRTALLIIVGTSGAALIPNQIVAEVLSNGGTIIDINIEQNKFSEIAMSSPGGMFLKGASSEILPIIAGRLRTIVHSAGVVSPF